MFNKKRVLSIAKKVSSSREFTLRSFIFQIESKKIDSVEAKKQIQNFKILNLINDYQFKELSKLIKGKNNV